MAKQTYNKVFTQEKWEKVNKYNKQLLDDYILSIKADGKSEKTIKQYYNDARIILIYIMEDHKNKEFYKLKAKSFRNFKLWCQDREMSPARTNRLLVTCRNLINFGMEDEEFEDDFEECKINTNRLKGLQKEEVRKIVFLTDEEIEIIYNRLVQDEKYSQALLCALLYDTSSRRAECFQVKREDISLDKNITKNEVIGKRKKKFKLIYNDRTKEAFKLLEDNRNDNYETVWLTISGEPASYESLYNWVITWRDILKDETGVYKEFNVHSFRHSAATNLENGTHYIAKKLGKKFELQKIQKLMNHESIETTVSYIESRTEDELLEAFELI